MRNRGPFMTSFFSFFNRFKVIYCDKTTIEVSTLPTICNFKRSDPIFCYKIQGHLFLLWRHYLQIENKRQKVVYHVLRQIGGLKSIFDGTLKWRVCFWDHSCKILQFWLLWVTPLNPKLGQKGRKFVFHVPMMIERWKWIIKVNLK